ncbi:MAG: hypothetical protein L7S53_01315 [Luminiphilus sp.]|nr:hypothetical protein [Luminiphilus sp.]
MNWTLPRPARIILNRMMAFAFLAITPVSTVWAWSDHASLIWPLLRSQPQLIHQTVVAEPLDAFLAAEQAGIAETLKAVESWSVTAIEHYPPTPEDLRWGTDHAPTAERFFAAIRVNPMLPYRLYVDLSPERNQPEQASLAWSELSFLGGGTSQLAGRYWALAPGEPVSIAEVIASANDEPDFGIDIGLFTDNGTEFGQRYGFGIQPFGNPNLEYGSQAPFHMGFYHLDWLSRTAQPSLRRTYPLWRIALFGELAELAFSTGHEYWGWRFLGWGLHYVGALTQPYHAIPLPGVDTVDALWSVVQGKTGELVQLVSNRHGVIESYQYHRLTRALEARQWSAPLLKAISDHPDTADVEYESFVMALTADSVEAAADFDAAIERNVPARFVSDPTFEWTGSGFEQSIVQRVADEQGEPAIAELDAAVILQLARFSAVASRWIARGRVAEPVAQRGNP